MYIKYNDKIYELIYCGVVDKEVVSTYFKEKTDETFYEIFDYYAKDFINTDVNIQDIYNVDFYVSYTDESETLKQAPTVERWCVNEGRPMYRNPELEKNELGIVLQQVTRSDDWIQDDKCSCSKIIDLYECSDYTVKYTYTFKDGKKLDEKEIVEVKMKAEEFKAEILKYRSENI